MSASKFIVDLEEYRAWRAWRKAINDQPVENIEWRREGKPVEVPEGAFDEFKWIGMNNTDFPSLYLGEDGIKVHVLVATKKEDK